jgi:hypothetical protein
LHYKLLTRPVDREGALHEGGGGRKEEEEEEEEELLNKEN